MLGFISMAIGFVGIIIPILPTTPFLLLASFFFMKGSERFDAWFKQTKIYKDYAEDFVNDRSMTIKRKMTILLTADFMIAFPFFILKNTVIRIMLIMIVFLKYYYFIFHIKTKKDMK